MQTLPNGIKVFTNGDDYNLADDMATFGKTSNVIIPVNTQTQRDALPDKFPGMTVRRLDMRGTLEWWDGTGWVSQRGIPYTPIWAGFTNLGVGGALTGTYWIHGDLVTVKSRALSGEGASLGVNLITCPLPPGLPIAGESTLFMGSGAANTGGAVRLLTVMGNNSSSVSVWAPGAGPRDPIVTPGNAGYPFTSGSYFDITFNYQTSIT